VFTGFPIPWQAHPDVWLLIVALAGGYLYALSAWGPRATPGRKAATRNQKILFFAGVGVLWVGADWPVHDVAEGYLYSVHMAQHMLFLYIAAPLLILGTPGWLFRRLLAPAPVFRAVRAMTRPLVALLAVNGYIVFTHWPAVVDASVRNGLLHFVLHVALVGLALIMWWPVLSPLPELPHLSYPGSMTYLFAHSIVPTVPASFLTFSHGALFDAYAAAPRLAGWLTAVQDQQIAGLLMKIGGGLLLWGVIAVLFFRWAMEDTTGGPDALYWRDIAADVEDAKMTQGS
jgi:putative membrane protein